MIEGNQLGVKQTSEDKAKGRFVVLQMLRLSGFVMALLGLAVVAGKVPLPEIAGYALLMIGALDALILPQVLARRWKTPTR